MDGKAEASNNNPITANIIPISELGIEPKAPNRGKMLNTIAIAPNTIEMIPKTSAGILVLFVIKELKTLANN